MIDVFKTNIECPEQANRLAHLLMAHFPGSLVNFDLQDCDRILRVKHAPITPDEIAGFVQQQGFCCEELPG